MESALGSSDTNIGDFFHPDFIWDGNRGCGVKEGLESFRIGWQYPFESVFTDRSYQTDTWLADGEWASCFGHCAATHSAEFMGIPASGKRIRIPYIDFWRVQDGLITYNKVSVDYADVLHQLGQDVFNGNGWESIGSTPGNKV